MSADAARQLMVDDDDIDSHRGELAQRDVAAPGVTDHDDVVLRREDRVQSLPNNRVVVDDVHTGCVGHT